MISFENHFEPLSMSSNLLTSTGLSLFPQEALNILLCKLRNIPVYSSKTPCLSSESLVRSQSQQSTVITLRHPLQTSNIQVRRWLLGEVKFPCPEDVSYSFYVLFSWAVRNCLAFTMFLPRRAGKAKWFFWSNCSTESAQHFLKPSQHINVSH